VALASGTRLGVYEIVALIGSGGMGEVYRARDSRLNRDVAIKVLPADVTGDHDRLARFEREAKVLASLNHPNIANIYGVDDSSGTPALVMELVEGPTLADRIAKGPIPLDEALPIAKQIAEALEAAHEQGIIHRDLKPANIKVRDDATVKVLDFGLAKAMEPIGAMPTGLSMSPTITSPAMTRAGIILGTAAYMSPEQARGKPVDKRADIWAFGCVLFEMLTGRRVFEAEDVSLTLAEVMKSEPDWTALPTLPPAVRMCVRRCLKKDSRQRLRDIGEVRLALEGAFDVEYVVETSTTSRSIDQRVWRRVVPFAATSALVAALLTWWISHSRPSPLPEVVRFQISAPPGSTIVPGTPAISPDGRTLAYVVRTDGSGQIYLRDLNSTDARPLPGTQNAVHPFWSPDGRSLAFVSDLTLKRIDIGGGSARGITRVSAPWHGSWGPFGDLLFSSNLTVLRVPAEGGSATDAVKLDSSAGENAAGFPSFLPDGKRFLIRVDRGNAGSGLYLASLESPRMTLVLDGVFSAALVAPTPQRNASYLLYVRDDALVAHAFDERAGAVKGTPRLLVDNIGLVANPPFLPTVGVSAAGVLAFQSGAALASGGFEWVSRTGEALTPIELAGSIPSLSPDGRWLAVTNRTRGIDIWVMDLSRNVPSQLTHGGGVVGSPIWSPDSRRLAFGRSNKIYVMNADGSAEPTVLADVRGVPTSWSSDDKYLVYGTPEGKLFLWPLNGGATKTLVGSRDSSSREGQLSPDGRYIAYTAVESGGNNVYLQPLPPATGRIQISATGGRSPRWGQTGRELFFISMSSGGPEVMAVDVTLGQVPPVGVPRRLFKLPPSFGVFSFDVSADGQRFVVPRLPTEAQDAPITVVLNWWTAFAKSPN
jgi:serine/threonine protein kinase